LCHGLVNNFFKGCDLAAYRREATLSAAIAAPMQGLTEISLGVLLVVGLVTRPAAFVAFLFLGSLWISEWGCGSSKRFPSEKRVTYRRIVSSKSIGAVFSSTIKSGSRREE
jgi:uncharacterized membrane protein YphA (DoxX/SURF4 family)